MSQTLEQRIQSLERHLSAEPQSPLFAWLAECYLEAGRSQEALSLCDSGLAHHPFYTTGHLMKGKVLLALNMRSEARREFEFVHEMLPFTESVQRLLSGLPADSLGAAPSPPAPAPAEPPVLAEAAPQEPTATEPSAEQVLSQFTEESPPAEPPPTPEASEQPASTGEAEDVFGLGAVEAPSADVEPPAAVVPEPSSFLQPSESFESFSERTRGELFGMENSLSLEEYLAEQTVPTAAVEEAPAEPPAIAPEPEAAPSEAAPSDEDPFAALTQFEEQQSPPVLSAPVEEQSTEQTEDPFAQLHQSVEETPAQETTVATTEESEDPFAQLRQAPEEPPAEEAAPAAGESPAQTAEQPRDQIEELAEKLKDARKITPVINLSEHTVTPTSEEDTLSGTGFVTPTLAEIYAKQGWFDDAIKAYRTLATTKPAERDRYEARIRELEEEKKKQEGSG